MLVSLGWTNQNTDLLPEGLNLKPDLIPLHTPAQWKATVSQKRAEILEERARHLPLKAVSYLVCSKRRARCKQILLESFFFF